MDKDTALPDMPEAIEAGLLVALRENTAVLVNDPAEPVLLIPDGLGVHPCTPVVSIVVADVSPRRVHVYRCRDMAGTS